MAAQTVMVRRVVVIPALLLLAVSKRCVQDALTLQLRHCQHLHHEKEKVAQRTSVNTFITLTHLNTDIWTASASRPYVPVCGCELRFGVLFASPRRRGALSVSRQKPRACAWEREKKRRGVQKKESKKGVRLG